MPRCPNGTKRNKSTGKCEPSNKSVSKKSPSPSPKPKKNKTSKNTDKCSKGVKMPPHRIEKIIKHEKLVNDAVGMSQDAEYYNEMEMVLNKLCFPKNTNWEKTGTYTSASIAAINNKI
jgi:hypothetical protein